jgi:acetyl esterase/lipase
MKKILFLLIILISLSITTYSQNAEYKPVKFPKDYRAQLDVIYTKVNGWNGRMDLYTIPKSEIPTPVVINIHGGGWNHGLKESQTDYGLFFKRGYAVANVEYRLVDVAPAPAAIEDVRCALIYLYNHAQELNINTKKIVIMGGSSGGHLALMAGLLANNKRFDTNCMSDEKINVAAIIDKYGVTNLVPLNKWGSAKRWLVNEFGNIEFVKSVSPIYHVTKNSPPLFVVHGDSDPIVPYSQSLELVKKLLSLGVKTKFVTIPNGKHGKFSDEDKRKVNIQLWEFLDDLKL